MRQVSLWSSFNKNALDVRGTIGQNRSVRALLFISDKQASHIACDVHDLQVLKKITVRPFLGNGVGWVANHEPGKGLKHLRDLIQRNLGRYYELETRKED